MGMIDMLTLGNLIPQKATAPTQVGFRTDVIVEDGDDDYDTVAEVLAIVNAGVLGVWLTAWEMTIPAQQMVHWGYGSPTTPQNQGYINIWFLDAAAGYCTGTVRLVQSNARRTKKLVVAEFSANTLHAVAIAAGSGNLLNKNEMVAIPEKINFPMVGEDSIIGIEFRHNTAASVALVVDEVGIKVPITVYQ